MSATSFDYAPLALARAGLADDADFERLGLPRPQNIGADPFEDMAFGDQTFYRYQYDQIFVYARRDSGDVSYYPFEFRTWVESTRPLSEAVQRHIRLDDNPRLQQLFDSGPYADGWVRGFNFGSQKSREETNQQIAADDVQNLGIPQFEVLWYAGSTEPEGEATGFFDPFAGVEEAPQEERWTVSYNAARDDYEIRSQGGTKRRLKESPPKDVYLAGKFIGRTQPSRGSVRLKNEYATGPTYTNPSTGNRLWSRRGIINEGLMSPSAVRDGGVVWKVSETADEVFLVPTKPDGLDPVAPADQPDRRRVSLMFGDSTTFEVRRDDLAGRYPPNAVREISEGTNLML